MMMGFGLLWIVIIVIGLIFLAREGFGVQGAGSMKQLGRHENTGAIAMDILNQRYARGEITQEQYLIMKQDLV